MGVEEEPFGCFLSLVKPIARLRQRSLETHVVWMEHLVRGAYLLFSSMQALQGI